jgi:hypothetical protein
MKVEFKDIFMLAAPCAQAYCPESQPHTAHAMNRPRIHADLGRLTVCQWRQSAPSCYASSPLRYR